MAQSQMERIAATLQSVARPDMTPKQLLKAARKIHPKASKKEIAQADFYSIISARIGNRPRPSVFMDLQSRRAGDVINRTCLAAKFQPRHHPPEMTYAAW